MRTRGCRLAVVHDRDEMEREFRRLHDPAHPNLALQEFIPGGLGDATWMLNAYFDRDGRCTFALTGRKLRQLPVNGGMTACGVCEPCETLAPAMTAIVKASGYHGVIDADFIHDRRDGRWKLIDINPRVGATFRLFVDKNGTDCVRALYLDLTGQAPPATAPDWQRKWLVEDKDLLSALWSVRRGQLSMGEWLKSLRGVKEVAHLALDDWAPSWLFLKRFVGGRLARAFGKRVRPQPHSGAPVERSSTTP
jgi:D-aspartate ligase